jgi:hypothetical protein
VLADKLHLNLEVQAYQYHLGKFCTDARGAILEKINAGSSIFKYRFKNPLFRSYVAITYYNQREKKTV